MKNKFQVLFCLTVMLFCSNVILFSQDWPQWRGPDRDGKVTDFTMPREWPASFHLQWRDTVGTGDATPALVENNLYVFTRQGDEEVIRCLDASSGKELWKKTYPAPPVTGAAARHPGPRSSPAVAQNRIVTLGATGILSCLDTKTGDLQWRKEPYPGVVPMFFTASSPMIVGHLCIAFLGGAGNGGLIAFDLNSGEEKWRWEGEGPNYGSPVLREYGGSKQVVTLTEKSLVGVDLSTGELCWSVPFPQQRRAYNASTPVLNKGLVCFSGSGRGTRAIRLEKKENTWDPLEVWNNPDVSVQFNTPVLKYDMLFGYSDKGNLFCLDALMGKTNWIDTVKRDRSGFAAIVDAGPVMMALPPDGNLIVYEPDGLSYREIAIIKVADSPTYAHPVVSGDRLYIKDEETVTLWIIED